MINFNNAEFEKSVGRADQITNSNLPEIVFSGKSNVGKSSLINRLLNRRSLARTSSKPGKTITINFYSVDKIKFVDLPGYGYAKAPKAGKARWSKLVEGYFNLRRNIALVVQIIDMRHPPSVLDMQMLDYLYQKDIPFVIVASKSDKLNKTELLKRQNDLEKELEKYKYVPKIIFSSVTGEGLDRLKKVIWDVLKGSEFNGKQN